MNISHDFCIFFRLIIVFIFDNDFIFNSVHARNYQKRKERCKYVALTLFILSSNVGSFLLGHYYNSLF